MSEDATLSDLLHESRRFPPPESLAAGANVRADWLAFWADTAERLTWDRRWDRVLDWQPTRHKTYSGG